MADMRRFLDLTGLGIYDELIKGVISTGDASTLGEAKKYFDDNKGLFEAAGTVKTAQEALQAAIDAVDAKVAAITDGESIDSFADVEAALAGKQAVGDYATKAEAQSYADAKDSAIAEAKKVGTDAQSALDAYKTDNNAAVEALDAKIGEIPEGATATDVIGYVQERTSGIATESALSELQAAVAQAQKDIDAVEADYLKAADKTALEGEITAVETAVATEKSRAEGKEAELAASIKAISDNYLKASDKEELQDNIDTLTGVVETLSEGVDADKVDGVKDLIAYVEEHGAEVTGMQESIADNAEAIEGVVGRMDTAEGKITAVEGAVATKAEQSVLDEAVEALENADAGQIERIAALESAIGESGSVAEDIAAAKQEAINESATAAAAKDAELETKITAAYKKYADDEDALIEARVATLETASATHALNTDVEAVSGKVTTLEGKVSTLETEMDAAQEAIDAKASAADLTALAGRVTTTEGKITTLEGEMNAVEGRLDDAEDTIAEKADASTVEALANRMTTAETNISANTTALSKFTEITESEINSLFAQ